MVKDAAERLANYNSKVDADATRIRIVARKDTMGQHFGTRAGSVATSQAAIRTQLNLLTGVNKIFPLFSAPYMAAGMQILGLKNKGYTGDILDAEVAIVFANYKTRGCTESGLNAVATAMEVPLPY